MFPSYLKPEAKLFYADTVHARIQDLINRRNNDLKEGQSLLVEVLLNDGRAILPSFFGFQNPSFIIAKGTDNNGNDIVALIPHTSIQIVMTVLNEPAKRTPIGFQSNDTKKDI
jgi:hypothetical protein